MSNQIRRFIVLKSKQKTWYFTCCCKRIIYKFHKIFVESSGWCLLLDRRTARMDFIIILYWICTYSRSRRCYCRKVWWQMDTIIGHSINSHFHNTHTTCRRIWYVHNANQIQEHSNLGMMKKLPTKTNCSHGAYNLT